MKLYIASSWKCENYLKVLAAIREAGHDAYDFRDPATGGGFSWPWIDSGYKDWTFRQYRDALQHHVAKKAFLNDFNAMSNADACVVVQPCGVSAHVEGAWFAGARKPVFSVGMPREADLMLGVFLALYSLDELDKMTADLAAVEDYLQFAEVQPTDLMAKFSFFRKHGRSPFSDENDA